ncbi:hypothetical protein ABZ816_03650 [Actinosynnema sp. NPDC047251]|uniref:Uncharacterized protein n=1 Tax=Saccharothrix espanaensis (strain ATCC 51144 / DSM 44229 / JCM 9112 / NBRC 15066 / NRRL 15764) TaxID=1179773 RepID=K0K461_SACES|nr:hypothetical protein [Saccharothrix espanaensis]CCH31353.1 hypothetical protein BN6_40670 [Saccharothrix espanaensis DSM 44229]
MKPDLSTLRAAVVAFGGGTEPEKSWTVLLAATAPAIDLALPAHREAAHRWLNAWGCRIRYPKAGEPPVFDTALAAWWERWHAALPTARTRLGGLADEQIAELGACFADLVATPAAATRSLGPTAAAKLLFALRPNSLMPWDDLIAQKLHGARDGTADVAHLTLGRTWAVELLAEAGTDEPDLVAQLGRPGRSLAKVLDEYCYLVHTREWSAAAG